MVLRLEKGILYLIYALYHQAAFRISTSFSRYFAVCGLTVLKFC